MEVSRKNFVWNVFSEKITFALIGITKLTLFDFSNRKSISIWASFLLQNGDYKISENWFEFKWSGSFWENATYAVSNFVERIELSVDDRSDVIIRRRLGFRRVGHFTRHLKIFSTKIIRLLSSVIFGLIRFRALSHFEFHLVPMFWEYGFILISTMWKIT